MSQKVQGAKPTQREIKLDVFWKRESDYPKEFFWSLWKKYVLRLTPV